MLSIQRYLKEDIHGYRSTPQVMNVGNSESRIGVKGSHDVEKFSAHYKLELGVDSTYQNDKYNSTGGTAFGKTSGRIRIRLANVKLKTKFGAFTLGQDYTATAKMVLGLDPLADTSVGGSHTFSSRVSSKYF